MAEYQGGEAEEPVMRIQRLRIPYSVENEPTSGAMCFSDGRLALGLYRGGFATYDLGVGNFDYGALDLVPGDCTVSGVQFVTGGVAMLAQFRAESSTVPPDWDYRILLATERASNTEHLLSLPPGLWAQVRCDADDVFVVYRSDADSGAASLIAVNAATSKVAWTQQLGGLYRVDRIGDSLICLLKSDPGAFDRIEERSVDNGTVVNSWGIPKLDDVKWTTVHRTSAHSWWLGGTSVDDRKSVIVKWQPSSASLGEVRAIDVAGVFGQQLFENRQEDAEGCGWDLSHVARIVERPQGRGVVAVLGGSGDGIGGACQSGCAVAIVSETDDDPMRFQVIDEDEGVTGLAQLDARRWLLACATDFYLLDESH